MATAEWRCPRCGTKHEVEPKACKLCRMPNPAPPGWALPEQSPMPEE